MVVVEGAIGGIAEDRSASMAACAQQGLHRLLLRSVDREIRPLPVGGLRRRDRPHFFRPGEKPLTQRRRRSRLVVEGFHCRTLRWNSSRDELNQASGGKRATNPLPAR